MHESKYWNAFVPGTVLDAASATENCFCPHDAYNSSDRATQ